MRSKMKFQYLFDVVLVTIIFLKCCGGYKTDDTSSEAETTTSGYKHQHINDSDEDQLPPRWNTMYSSYTTEITTDSLLQRPKTVPPDDQVIKYCSDITDSTGLKTQKWCSTNVNSKFVFPCINPCKNDDGTYAMRRCELFNNTPTWSKTYNRCNKTNNFNQSNLTMLLNSTQHELSPNKLNEVSTHITTEKLKFTELDIDIAANILENTSKRPTKIEYTEPFFSVVNNLLNVNHSVLKTCRDFGSTDKIIKSIDNFVIGLSQEKTSYSLNLTNIAVEITNPTQSNDNNDYFRVNFSKIDVKIPIELLNTCTLTTFKSNNLFLEGNVVSEIVDLKVFGVKEILNNSISLYLPVEARDEVVCSFWEFNEDEVGNWSMDGVETIRLSDNLVECKTNHLTAFVLLGVSDRIIESLSNSNQLALEIISTILCTFSLIGLIMIFITSFVLKKWYSRRINTIQISGVIAVEIILIFLNDVITIKEGLGCIIFGIFMHYLVLVKFLIMLLIARMQYENFVIVLTSRNRSRNFLLGTLIAFSIPILIVGISAGVFPDDYNPGNVNFCYPKDAAFRYFLIIPIASTLTANIIIFSLVMFQISSSISRDNKQKILQIKLSVMLFFMLGLTWIFSVLSHVIVTPSLQLALIYIFSILSPLQGFVIFVFAIVFDSDAKTFWLNCCKKFKYKAVDTESSKQTTSSAVLMSSIDLN
ncbi:adhesion G-protein coupled receptor G2-like [Onthophagus taurus]|uniref:adhesion G-protein coupled receptor G2-like n=1 Tax=Onthophagus taurus TaxID=166361 RepID=UPI0039BEBED3